MNRTIVGLKFEYLKGINWNHNSFESNYSRIEIGSIGRGQLRTYKRLNRTIVGLKSHFTSPKVNVALIRLNRTIVGLKFFVIESYILSAKLFESNYSRIEIISKQ